MNNVTISDLSEKSTLEDTDLFLVRDSNDADMKIKGKVFADKITDSLSGYTKDNDTLSTLNTASKKPVNSSAVNSALANLKSLNIDTTKTDANLCYNVNAKVSFYRLPTTATNIPKTNGLFFIQSNGYYLDGVIRINQIATSNGNDNDNTIYTRKGYNSGNEIIWTSWTKLTTETDLNTTLAAQGVSNIFTIGENFNLSDIKIYANTTLLNIQRFIVIPKNAITSSTNYVVGTLSSYRPKQVLRFTAYVNHKGVEGYIETNGNVIVYLESGASGNIFFDNIVYFY